MAPRPPAMSPQDQASFPPTGGLSGGDPVRSNGVAGSRDGMSGLFSHAGNFSSSNSTGGSTVGHSARMSAAAGDGNLARPQQVSAPASSSTQSVMTWDQWDKTQATQSQSQSSSGTSNTQAGDLPVPRRRNVTSSSTSAGHSARNQQSQAQAGEVPFGKQEKTKAIDPLE